MIHILKNIHPEQVIVVSNKAFKWPATSQTVNEIWSVLQLCLFYPSSPPISQQLIIAEFFKMYHSCRSKPNISSCNEKHLYWLSACKFSYHTKHPDTWKGMPDCVSEGGLWLVHCNTGSFLHVTKISIFRCKYKFVWCPVVLALQNSLQMCILAEFKLGEIWDRRTRQCLLHFF